MTVGGLLALILGLVAYWAFAGFMYSKDKGTFGDKTPPEHPYQMSLMMMAIVVGGLAVLAGVGYGLYLFFTSGVLNTEIF